MDCLDARRLTGPSLLFDEPAAVLDVLCTTAEAAAFVPAWQARVEQMLAALGWAPAQYRHCELKGGVSVAFTAPIDALYAATEINEWAFATVLAEQQGTVPPDLQDAQSNIATSAAEERNDALLALQAAAVEHGARFLWDDDTASLGFGCSSSSWSVRELPAPAALDWSRFADVPVGIVTGTNGKTTTVRLAAHILRGAGKTVGLSSTDWIAVHNTVLDRGDWSGPGGARAVLRHPDVDVAVLECARGGLLRRGLGVNQANAALITNIAADHLGDFGSRSIDELLNIKWLISRSVRDAGTLILNADDPRLVTKARDYDGKLCWFSLDARNTVVERHVANGGTAFVYDGDKLLQVSRDTSIEICAAQDIPITLGGAALHNIANALAAAVLTSMLGASIDDIRAGLTTMSQDENPGRCNVYEIGTRKVLVDFAHNPHAMQALFDMAQALPARRRALCFGQAGDRPDDLIREMTRAAFAIGLDQVFVSELAPYHRGRQHGEVFGLIRDELLHLGLDASRIVHHELESETLDAAMRWAQDGDLVIMLALGGAAPIQAQIRALTPATG